MKNIVSPTIAGEPFPKIGKGEKEAIAYNGASLKRSSTCIIVAPNMTHLRTRARALQTHILPM